MSKFIQVTTTVSFPDDGVLLARMLVEQRLAACVHISESITSIYRWQGEIEEAIEYIVSVKSKASLFTQLVGVVEQHHAYDLPELIATPFECSPRYAAWLLGELHHD